MAPAAADRARPSGPVLITGCPRSGTTFVGSIFEASRDIFEVYEPFNHAFTYNLQLPGRFFRITDENAKAYRPRFDRLLQLSSLHSRLAMLPKGVTERRKPKSNQELASTLALKKLYNKPGCFLTGKRLSLKDPLAFFSAEWLAKTYDMPVIVMARHPGGVVSSFLKLGWPPETPDIVDYPLPVSKGSLDREIAAWRANPNDTVGALILQRKIFTQHTLDLKKRHPDWKFALHRDVCTYPEEVMRDMFDYAGVEFTPQVAEGLRQNTQADVVDTKEAIQHALTRNSSELPSAWVRRVDPDIARRITTETEELWDRAQRELSYQPAEPSLA